MIVRTEHPTRRRRLVGLAVLLAAVAIAFPSGLANARVVIRASDRPDPSVATDPSVASGPSIQYLEAQAHADDRIDFTPGGRVAIPFRPRADDRQPVAGRAPVALPAGRASGGQLAAMPTGRTWADVPGVAVPDTSAAGGAPEVGGVDRPATDPTGLVPAVQAAARSPAVSPEAAPTATSALRRDVFGFLPYWEVSDSSTTLDDDVLSTIAYFGVGADKAGNLLKSSGGSPTVGWSGWTSAKMTSIIDAAHRHGTRVVLTVQLFAWTSTQAANQAAFLASPAARLNLAKQAAAAVRDRGADGINLDFEPIVSGYADEFTAFVRQLRTQLDALAKGYQLTFDTTGYIGNYPIEDATAPGGADAIFVMGYDYRTASASAAGSIAPLSGPLYDITDTVDAYLARVPPSKVILGVPYYGRAWSTVSNAPNAKTQTGEKYGYSASVVYDTAADYAATYGHRYDSGEQTGWTVYQRQNCTSTYGCVTSWRELYFDDPTSLGAKYDLVNRRGLRGAGIWALGYDGTRPDLDRVLRAKFLQDTTDPVAGIDVLPATQSDEGFRVAWSGEDDTGVASYAVQVSVDGGAWSTWRSPIDASSDLFVGATGHRYAFRVQATDLHGNRSAWDVTSTGGPPASLAAGAFGTVAADPLNVRSAAGTSAAIVGSLHAGDVVRLTGGPTTANGYTWYEVTGPLREWGPVSEPMSDVWVAASGAATPYVVPRQPPNVSTVDAGIAGLRLGPGGAAAPGGGTTFSPNGDGVDDVLPIGWTGRVALSAATLSVWRTDGSLVGTKALGPQPAGVIHLTWDGTLGGKPVPDGDYVLTISGTGGSRTYSAPAPGPLPAAAAGPYTVTIDRIVVTRLAGSDRFATAAAISRASFPSGAPVAYVATGQNYPDALAGSVAAARAGGPLLLVTATSVPTATATELGRLKPGRIVVLGGPSVVGATVAAAAADAARH